MLTPKNQEASEISRKFGKRLKSSSHKNVNNTTTTTKKQQKDFKETALPESCAALKEDNSERSSNIYRQVIWLLIHSS